MIIDFPNVNQQSVVLNMGAWSWSTEFADEPVIATGVGVEYTLPKNRAHFTIPRNRAHYTLPKDA